MAKIEDRRLYIVRERAYYESPRGQQIFAVAKSELDTAEKDVNGIIREENSRVLCLARNPKDYMESVVLPERKKNNEPLVPAVDASVSAPKHNIGRVEVGVATELMVKDVQNNGILQPLREGDVLTRGGGLLNLLVVRKGDKLFAATGDPKIDPEELTAETIKRRAYRKIGTVKENPELVDNHLEASEEVKQ